ncbi:ribosomal large subunit pseudouridine synthase A [Fragilariopsis cylindrus CCMP1102]|uniref:Ribosomal large subunit pseudouridine synthase A n=1 Tax=Fragilariopsis cylindrus CCMP1102 TaxID=635003 RepID=A0A1E7EKR0_9STRA|nr:ribosomal large subunit pseudouridine synthase A [Fragilariopsis cylindrus CCMP1102]|eukprot:OEU06476.1 ribosomal large subunit pseudouridine synthase A [Fragilariopsis cylindrus CCMP1102]
MLSKKRRRQQQEDSGKQSTSVLSIVYEDDWLVVVNKPHNVLSVPGRNIQDSIYTELKNQYPNATGPLLVHRLDYSTSGLLLATKDSNTHKHVQAQFIQRTVKKRYTALLEGNLLIQKSNHTSNNINTNMMMMKGTIDLPLAGDYLNRPMQKVDRGPEGKPAVTHYEIIDDGREEDSTRIHFYPVTGRTHQLRVHASHPEGLGIAIVGDDIYGQRDERLCLHAGFLQIDHPKTGKRITFTAPIPF